MLKVWFFAVMFFLSATSSSPAQDATEAEHISPEQLFSRGNEYYENGEYTKAIDEYRKILDDGYESGPVYYNIANAYFKSGKLGKAILSYRRARRIMPRDVDLVANYKFAQAEIKGKVVARKGIWSWRPFRLYSQNFTIDELTWMASGVYLLIIAAGFVLVIRPTQNRYWLKATVLLLLVFILFNVTVIWLKVSAIKRGAVVVVSTAEALFGPYDSATKFFTLYEGMRVTVLKTKGDWYKIRRADGKVGWVRVSEVERIYNV
ncbi:MAG: tetratricopeptide repeat protein [Candidatus Omnitrophota bacterium]